MFKSLIASIINNNINIVTIIIINNGKYNNKIIINNNINNVTINIINYNNKKYMRSIINI